jgi:hypothetical protein
MTAWRPDTQASKNPMSPQREPHNLSIRSGQHLQHAREERREGGGGEGLGLGPCLPYTVASTYLITDSMSGREIHTHTCQDLVMHCLYLILKHPN